MAARKKSKPLPIKWLLLATGIVIAGIILSRTDTPNKLTQSGNVTAGDDYSITYPADWTIDTSRATPADIISNKDGTAKVAIQRLVGDKRLLSRTGITAVMKELKDSYTIDKKYTVDSMEGITWKGLPAFFATGAFTDNDELWDFEEYSIFFGSEIFNLRANVKQGKENAANQDKIKLIVNSFKINGYQSGTDENINNALAEVMSLAEVRNFQKDVFENNQSKFSIYLDSDPTKETSFYVIVVAEFFPDHRTTFNRYRVGKNSRTIHKYDIATDTWDKIQ